MIISIMNRKGGAGKTAICINVAACFATQLLKKNEKVLVIDLDPQANATTYLGEYNNENRNINDVICKNESIENIIVETKIKNLYLAPSYLTLDEADAYLTRVLISKEFVLKKKLLPIKDEYKYIFIDCPPARNNLTTNALTASDYTILPCEATEYGFDSLMAMSSFIPAICSEINSNLKVAGIVFSKKEHTQVQKVYEESIREHLDYPVFNTAIRKTTAVERSLNAHEPMIIYDKNAPVTQDYIALAKEIYSKTKE